MGTAGDVGQWEDYIDESVKAEGYVYVSSGKSVTILTDENSKGAVGFKIYDKYDNMVSFSNTYKLTLPADVANSKYRVVAVQADGSNVTIPSAAEAGNEEQQLEALEKAISAAKEILRYKASNNTQVGYYDPNAVAMLETLVETAQEAINNKDQSIFTYGKWSINILNEILRLEKDSKAMINVAPYNHYTLTTRLGALAYHNGSVKAASASQVKPSDNNRRWEFVPVTDNAVYMKSVGQGSYIKTGDSSVELVSSESEAKMMSIIFNGDGTISFADKSSDAVRILGVNSDKSATTLDAIETNSQWKVVMVVDNTGIDEVTTNDDKEVIYDLTGRRIDEITVPGIYIVNGKKILIK